MSRADKWDQITLVNSKCSDSTIDTHSLLYRAVIRNLKEDKCHLHQYKYEFYYQHRLMCSECFAAALSQGPRPVAPSLKKKYEYFYHLETILNHPIILVIDQGELFSHPFELMALALSSYKQIYPKKSDLKIQRQCLESFIARMKSRIEHLCDSILVSFNEMQQNLSTQGELREELSNLEIMYQNQLMEMLGGSFVEGSKQELEKILEEYANSNENPLTKILTNVEDFMNVISSSPFLDIKALAELYRTVTDERTWKIEKIIRSLEQTKYSAESTADMIIDFDRVPLQGQYTLCVRDNEATLEMDSKVISKLELQLDSLYHLSGYKLLGVNYDKLMVIDYFDHLSIEKEYFLTGCTDVLPFEDSIITISNDGLSRIDRKTHQIQHLGQNYKNLKYLSSDRFGFSCQNQQEQCIRWASTAKLVPSKAS